MQSWELLSARSETTTYTTPSGVQTTVMASAPNYHSLPIMAVCGLLIIWLLRPSIRSEFATARRVVVPPIPQVSPAPTGSTMVAAPPPLRAAATPSPAKQRLAFALFIACLLGFALYMGWLAVSGVSSGETYFPAKRPSQQRSVVREQEPVTFWVSIGVHAAVGLASGGFGVWLLVAGIRGRSSRELSERPY